ncbi:DUF1573 domain-containing protein [Kordia sp.]|uniref:DUF1573 domain-containing protein n=1 Tax=Kordia sp. TaxID=1965332 RepID=UPI0025BE7F9F|nr:DUF1573 domain-containing protein [Kordia sp.]MCH2194434.1 DUF1573 domain-containing protein [Kordia sp.]
MKKIFTILFVSLFTMAIQAQEKTAKIKFKSETIDYGTIEKGADGVRVFEFENTGTAPLVITRVYSSCGCTIPKKPEKPILPGESGVIEVKYDTKRVGPIRKTITVYSNADEPTKAIKIKGKIVDPSKSKSIMMKDKSEIES